MTKSLFEKLVDRSATSLTKDDLKGITKLGSYSLAGGLFEYFNLSSIEIPDNIVEIGDHAFSYNAIPNIEIPSNIIKIGSGAFSYCNFLTQIPTTPSVDYISESMFYSCKGFVDVTIPENIKTINSGAFGTCTALKTLKITPNVNYIGSGAFGNSTGAMAIKDAYFQQPSGMTITLPTAGTSGMFRVKTARNMNVYTDNETIKNYDWASDNITATLYHLDGTAW